MLQVRQRFVIHFIHDVEKIYKIFKGCLAISNMYEKIKICNLELASANAKKTILLVKFYSNKALPFIRDWSVFFEEAVFSIQLSVDVFQPATVHKVWSNHLNVFWLEYLFFQEFQKNSRNKWETDFNSVYSILLELNFGTIVFPVISWNL